MTSMIQRNLKRLEKTLKKNITYIDLNYKGAVQQENNATALAEPVELTAGSPVLNAYKMWLQSRSTSYIRNAGFGGYITENIFMYPFTPEYESTIANDIASLTADYWPNIELLSIDVKCMAPKKYWEIKVSVRDKITNLVAFDMYLTNDSITTSV